MAKNKESKSTSGAVTPLLPSEFYSAGLSDRKPYEDRAEQIASISLPYLIRKDGSGATTLLGSSASQSFNGRLFNNLKAKMGMALLPPSTSSFRLKPDALGVIGLFGEGNDRDEDGIAAMYADLSFKTDLINTELENQQIRTDAFDMILQLIGVGSVVTEKIKGKGIQIYPLKSFVVKLNSKGAPLTICVKETLSVLPEGIVPEKEEEEYELYTMVNYDKNSDKWIMTQDIAGVLVGEEKTFSSYNDLPFRYFGWTWMVGDKYHRPFAEDYYDDMNQVDKLSKLNTDGAVISAKSIIFVNPRGNRTKKSAISDSENGDVVDGSAEDITAFQFQKGHDFQVSNQREADIKKELKECFLDTGAITRDAERVTAEEIRRMAQQLEASTLAGIYSKMSLQFSKWIVERIIDELGIKFNATEVDVLTGLDALGRSQEAQKQDQFAQRLVAMGLQHWLIENELITRWANYDNINTVGLIKTPAQVKKELDDAKKQQGERLLIDSAAKSAGESSGKMITGQQ